MDDWLRRLRFSLEIFEESTRNAVAAWYVAHWVADGDFDAKEIIDFVSPQQEPWPAELELGLPKLMIVRSFVNDTSVLAVACSQVCIGDVVYQLEEDVQIAFIGKPLESIRLAGRAAMLLPKPEPEYMRYRSPGGVSEGGRYKLDDVPEGVTVFEFHPLDLVELVYQAGWNAEVKLGSPVQDLKLAGKYSRTGLT